MTTAAVLALTALLLLAAGCGGDDDEGSGAPEGTFVGRVSGTDAFIAVTSDSDRAGGYLCDSREVAEWLRASDLSGAKADLVARAGDRLGEVTIAGDTATGSVRVAGTSRRFTARRATGRAGLYREAGGGELGVVGNVETTWIVLPDGSQRGAKTTWVEPDIDPVAPEPAPKLRRTAQPWVDPDSEP